MSRVIYTNNEGGVSVIIPSGSIEDAMKDIPEGVAYEVVEDNDIPSDRSFRNAWEHDTSIAPEKILTNISKAQAITKDRLRSERQPLLAEQDILFNRALESNASTTAIVTEKNRLRDITAQVDTMTTLAQLKGVVV